jgi:hypothetical protein
MTREVQVQAVPAKKESSFGRTLLLRGNDPTNAQEAPSTTTTFSNISNVSNANNVSNVTIIPIILVDLMGELGNQLHHFLGPRMGNSIHAAPATVENCLSNHLLTGVQWGQVYENPSNNS